MMDRRDLTGLGHASMMVAVLLFAAGGLFAKYNSRVSSTPDPPISCATIYPDEVYWAPLLVAAIPVLLAAMVLLCRTRAQANM